VVSRPAAASLVAGRDTRPGEGYLTVMGGPYISAGARHAFIRDTCLAECLDTGCGWHARGTPGALAGQAGRHADQAGHLVQITRTHVTEVRPRRWAGEW